MRYFCENKSLIGFREGLDELLMLRDECIVSGNTDSKDEFYEVLKRTEKFSELFLSDAYRTVEYRGQTLARYMAEMLSFFESVVGFINFVTANNYVTDIAYGGKSDRIKDFFPFFGSFVGLNRIDIRKVDISVIPDNLPDSLKILVLIDTNVLVIPDSLPDSLEDLFLNDTDVSAIPDNLPKSLKRLFLINTDVSVIPDNLPGLLWLLCMDNTKVSVIPDSLPNSLRELFLNDTDVFAIPDILPDSLVWLYLKNTKVSVIPDNLPDSLRVLDISGTPAAESEEARGVLLEFKRRNPECEIIGVDLAA